MEYIRKLHRVLAFESKRPQFNESTSVGKIGVAGFVLGVLAGLSYATLVLSVIFVLFLSADANSYTHSLAVVMIQWSAYMSLLCTFHFLEFFVTAMYQPDNASYDSFVINHSFHYTLAFVASLVEFWVETALFGAAKRRPIVILVGLVLMIGGQTVRTLAMYTCAENFAHLIMDNGEGHRLVTVGIYSYFAHPSYVGWFYWSIGTQLLLCNPVCAPLYVYASWAFFHERIPYEEQVLFRCYREEYRQYRRSTHRGIPFISSPLLKNVM
mmetsp:Transcript_15052/g.24929  ORF Transcript_15052/g.24929 Transcript_15052/m.24929 type:complete len:268 (+) Transcript_15052:213-1016(+)